MNHENKHDADDREQNSKESKKTFKKIIHFKLWKFILLQVAIILVTVLITACATLAIYQQISGLNKEERQSMNKIQYVYKTLSHDYYKKQNNDKLTEAAINGMVKELKDPYSEYMTKEETESFNEDVSGDFVGIGAEMQKKNDQIMVTSPMKGSPAEKAGLRPKDVVTKVNGKSIKDKSLNEVVKMVRGKKGTKVTLTIQRGNEEKDIKIKRDKIHVKSVEYKKKDNVGIITINRFQEQTSGELKSAILKAHKEGVNNIVLDLRNNPGGLLNEAISMANIFIDKGKPVVKLEKGKDTETIDTSNDALKEAKDMKFSTLVNEGSASASEVFTGALKDYGIAKVYGTKTFGKGIVQTTKEFDDGSLLKYTQMKWLTPKGHYIHGKGIEPDTKINAPKYQSINVIPSNKTFEVGQTSKNIKSIKIGLSALGYDIDNENNQFDESLEKAVRKFQQDHDLIVNGKFNKETNNKFTQLLVEKANGEDKVLDQLIKDIK